MKTIKPLLFMLLVIGGLRGFAQCPSANFYFSVGPGGVVSFQDPSFYLDSNIISPTYTWNFGDGDTVQNNSYYLTHTYTSGGTYTVSLEISGGGCDSITSATVVVNLCAGGAQFSESVTGFGAYTFTPVNLSALPGATVLWNFGDGNTSTSTSPSYQYSASGGQTVILSVTDASLSCSIADTETLYVSLCNFNPSIDTTILAYNPVSIEFQPSLLNAGYSYAWSFGDGGTANTETPTHTYVANGTFTASLAISDAVTGCSATESRTMNINLCGVSEDFYYSGNGLTQSFFSTNLDSMNVDSTSVSIASYFWGLGGATPPTATTAEVDNVVFPATGNYTVCLFVTTNIGCIDTACHTVTITPPVYDISGSITKSGSGSGFGGVVYLIVQDSAGHLALLDSIISPSDTSSLDTMGNGFGYYFPNLPVDTYYVKAALGTLDPDYATYLPTYYGNVLNWDSATPVIISNAANNNVNIELIEGTNTGGPGFVGGYVSQGAGLIIGNQGNANAKALGDPISNAQVNLLTSNNQPVAYTYTDANGHYQFANLALGAYRIYVEQLNKIPTPLDFALTQQNPTDSGADMTVTSHGTTGVDNISSLQIMEVYPNPVVANVQLQIGCKQAVNATLKVVDILGRTNLEQEVKLISGQNTAEVNMSGFAAGVYQLVIQTGGQQVAYKIVKAK